MMQFAFSAVGIISNSPIVKQTFDLSLISLTILGRNKRLLSTRILKPCGLYNVPRFQSLANVCSACIFRRSASQCLLMHSNKISNLWIGTFRSIKMKIFRLSEHTVYRLRLLRNANITLCSGISLLVLGELWFMICQCSIVFCSEFNTKNHLFHECYDQESRKQNAPFPWNKLFHLLWQDIWYLILTIMCAIGAAVASIQIPIMLGDMTNIVCKFSSKTISNFFDDIRKPALKLLSVYIAQAALTFAYISVLSSVGERLAARLRSQLFSAYLHRDMAFFDSHKTGELIDRLTSDVQDFKSSFKMCVSQGLKAATQTIGCAVSLVCISPKLSVVMLVIIPTFIGGGAVLGGFLRQLSRKAQEQVGQSAAVANEAIGNIRTVRAFAMEEREMQLYEDQLSRCQQLNIRLGHGIGLFQGLANLFLNGIVLGSMFTGGWLISVGQLTPGSLISFLSASQMIEKSISQLSVLFGTVVRGMSAGCRVFEYVDSKSTTYSPSGVKIPLSALTGFVQFRNVSFAYPTRPTQMVLTGFNLDVPSGSVVALVGQSGGGKSTVAALLERFYDVSTGSILLDGYDIKELDLSWLRGQVIGFISQEPVLFAASILENIRYGRYDATDDEVMEAAKLANAHTFISQFPDGYHTVLGERGVTVSGGQKQRIAIARALIKNPFILILDEATSALDTESERMVQEALQRVTKGRTVFVIAHRLSTIQSADLIAVLSDGKVVEVGVHSSLQKKRGHYWKLTKQQVK